MAREDTEESPCSELPAAQKSILVSHMGLEDLWMNEDTEVNQGGGVPDPLVLYSEKSV